MNTEEKLEQLKEDKVCDQQTLDSLSHAPNMNDEIDLVYDNFLKTKAEAEKEGHEYNCGKKLLFLEELLHHPNSIQDQVMQWLKDKKRNKLFHLSPQGDLYGELLLAKAEERIPEYQREYNGENLNSQPKYEYPSKLNVETKGEDGKNVSNNKLEAILCVANQKLTKDTRRLERIIQKQLDRGLVEKMRKASRLTISQLKQEAEKGKNMKELEKIEREIERKTRRDHYERRAYRIDKLFDVYAKEWNCVEIDGSIGVDCLTDPLELKETDEENFYMEIEGLEETRDSLKKYREEIVEKNINDIRKGFVDKQFSLVSEGLRTLKQITSTDINEEEDELISLFSDSVEEDKKLSERLRKPCTVEYSLRLSNKDPLDVRYGNDSGCCIGIYDDSEKIGNAHGLPHMLADNSVYIFDINQKLKASKPKRVGIVLAFDCRQNEKRILAVNSLELSPSMNPKDVLPQIVKYTEEGLIDFAKGNEFDKVIVSNHPYNTSQNYSNSSGKIFKPREKIKKSKCANEQPFYSEIVKQKTGEISREEGFYILYERP